MTEASRKDALDQDQAIAGTESTRQADNLNLADEVAGLGVPIPGQAGGSAAVITFVAGSGLATANGLTGIDLSRSESLIEISGAGFPQNNGIFTIHNYNSPSSVDYENPNAIAPDPNNGSITWVQRYPYSLQTDLNYERTDRTDIKGVHYWQTVAPYQRPDAVGTNVPTNLTNISGKTTDAIALRGNREIFGIVVLAGQSVITVSDPGNLKHMDPVNTLGIPCFDVAPFVGDFRTCFVKVLDGYNTGGEMLVIQGPHAGERIFGVTKNGSSVSPDSVQVAFYSCPLWADISVMSSPYTWEVGQPNAVNLVYGYNERVDNFDFNIFRLDITIPSSSSSNSGGGLTPFEHETLRQLIHFIDEGPGDGFASGAIKKTRPLGSILPTSIIWYLDSSLTTKLVEKTIVWAGIVPATITWKVYNVDGVTVAHTVSDSITYVNTIFEDTRVRTIT